MGKYNRLNRYIKYPNEFKATAVLLSHLDGNTVKSVANSLNIHPVMLSNWRRDFDQGKIVYDKRKRIEKKSKTAKKSQEIQTLMKEIDRLKEENEILKKWQQFLAEQRRKSIDS